ncbi:hypothetical protein NQZ79_g647 [Umbelopsis isabellina]|nr:hypothetical protein NQZ79_g647 [Umbelopsis isabellina]
MLSSRLVSLLLVTIAASVSAAPVTKLKGVPGPMVEVHGMCSQNMACGKGLYCRRYNGDVFGSCEIPF